jgi:hypothetical protein
MAPANRASNWETSSPVSATNALAKSPRSALAETRRVRPVGGSGVIREPAAQTVQIRQFARHDHRDGVDESPFSREPHRDAFVEPGREPGAARTLE